MKRGYAAHMAKGTWTNWFHRSAFWVLGYSF